jgi:4,5-DOPA dioxygenase extradiol
MPPLFVGHGSPMNAIEENEFRRGWRDAAREIPRPEAILCISAHWETRGVAVTEAERPETIHDFYGFPKALFDVRYPAPGSPSLARRVAGLLSDELARLDPKRGLDHGSWSVLAAMFPEADVPVVQLSLDTNQPASFHLQVGRKLAPLRDERVLILGSGDVVHNLSLIDFGRPDGFDWAIRFNEAVKKLILAEDHDALARYESLGPDAPLAVPTAEHYLPLLYVLGAKAKGEPLRFFNDTVTMGSISMTSVFVG